MSLVLVERSHINFQEVFKTPGTKFLFLGNCRKPSSLKKQIDNIEVFQHDRI